MVSLGSGHPWPPGGCPFQSWTENETNVAGGQQAEQEIGKDERDDSYLDIPFLSKRQVQELANQVRAGCEATAFLKIDAYKAEKMKLEAKLVELEIQKAENMKLEVRLAKLEIQVAEANAVSGRPPESNGEQLENFEKGARVTTEGLRDVGRNCLAGTLLEYEAASDRWQFQPDGGGKILKIKPRNLKRMREPAATDGRSYEENAESNWYGECYQCGAGCHGEELDAGGGLCESCKASGPFPCKYGA